LKKEVNPEYERFWNVEGVNRNKLPRKGGTGNFLATISLLPNDLSLANQYLVTKHYTTKALE